MGLRFSSSLRFYRATTHSLLAGKNDFFNALIGQLQIIICTQSSRDGLGRARVPGGEGEIDEPKYYTFSGSEFR